MPTVVYTVFLLLYVVYVYVYMCMYILCMYTTRRSTVNEMDWTFTITQHERLYNSASSLAPKPS